MTVKPALCTELTISAAELDDSIADFAGLIELRVTGCPAEPRFPLVLLNLPLLRVVAISGERDVTVRVPDLIGQLPLTELRLDNVDVDALVLPATLQRLILWSRNALDDTARLQRKLAGTAVTAVRVCAEGSSRGLPAPEGWQALPQLRELDLASFSSAPDLAGIPLERLEVRLASLSDVKRIAHTCPTLQSLKVYADKGKLPDEIEELVNLKELALHVPLKDLPASIGKLPNLTALTLSKLPLRALPEAVGSMTALVELNVDAEVNTLPASLAQLAMLRRLRLRGALNKGALVSRWDSLKMLSPLPQVLSSLTSLEELDLSHCGVFDAAPLRPLQQLRVLKLNWSALESLEDIAALSALEELDLEHVDRVRDFSPLQKLQKLRSLNLSNTRPLSLDVLKELPGLRQLNISAIGAKNIRAVFDLDVELDANDEVLERYSARQGLRKLPPVEQILAGLGADNVEVACKSLDQLASWVLMSSTRDANAMLAALAEPEYRASLIASAEDGGGEDEEDEEDDEDDSYDDEDEEGDESSLAGQDGKVRWHLLEACLEQHIEALPTGVLSRLFAALFQQMHEDHPWTSKLADQIIVRGDDEDHRALVAAFAKATEYYDTGHRMWEDTVQDHLIDEVFAKLRQPALVQLLAACNAGYFVDDGMMDLWRPALERASAEDIEILRESFSGLAQHLVSYGSADELAGFWTLVDVEKAEARALVAEVRQGLSAELQSKERDATLQGLCASTDTLDEGLRQLLALDDATLEEVARRALQRLPVIRDGDGQPQGLAVTRDEQLIALATIYHRIDDEWSFRALFETVSARGPEAASQLMVRAGIETPRQARLLREVIVAALIKLEERRPWEADESDESGESDSNDDGALFELRTSETVAQLRAWAEHVDGHLGGDGRAVEFEIAVRRLGSFESATLRVVIGLLAEASAPVGGIDLSAQASELAGDIGRCADEEDMWPAYCLLARHLDKLALSGRTLERILAQLLGVSVNCEDMEAARNVLQNLPAVVAWDILAYNLACYFSSAGNREEMLRWVARSLELGKSPTQFAADEDFDAWRSDADFVRLMAPG